LNRTLFKALFLLKTPHLRATHLNDNIALFIRVLWRTLFKSGLDSLNLVLTETHILLWLTSMPHTRPTQSMIHVPLLVIRFHKIILLIVQYKYLKSCSEDFILKNPILRTRSCGTAFITQHSWLLHFHQAEICLVETICTTQLYQHRRGILEGPALKCFCMIHRGGRIYAYMIYTCIYMYIYTCRCIHISVNVHKFTHTHTNTHAHILMYDGSLKVLCRKQHLCGIYIYTHIHIFVNRNIYLYICIYIYMYI